MPLHVSEYWRICPLMQLVNPAGNTFPNSVMKYSFVPKCRGWGGGGGELSRFLKMMGVRVFLGLSLIMIIKWTWEFFSQNFAIWPPSPSLYNYEQKSAKKRCGICSTTLTIKTSERHQCFSLFSCFQCFCDAFVNFEQISHVVLEFILLVWTVKYPPSIFWSVHLFAFVLLAFLL